MNKKVLEANGGQPMLFYCVIHQQALCGKVLNWKHVMSVVVSNVNFIKNHALNHSQFQTFLADLDCKYVLRCTTMKTAGSAEERF